MDKISVPTRNRVQIIDITSKINVILADNQWLDGVLTLLVPHTTAGLTINENTDADVKRDMLMELKKIIPFEDGYLHAEGNSAAHIKTAFIGSSETIIVENGKLQLGTWQGIYFMEFDGPRKRSLYIKFLPGSV